MGALGTSNSVAVNLNIKYIYMYVCIYSHKYMTLLDILKHNDSIEDCRNM